MTRTYTITRTHEDRWTIRTDENVFRTCLDLEWAVAVCESEDGKRGLDWDFDTRGQCEDGLLALRVGESLEADPAAFVECED